MVIYVCILLSLQLVAILTDEESYQAHMISLLLYLPMYGRILGLW